MCYRSLLPYQTPAYMKYFGSATRYYRRQKSYLNAEIRSADCAALGSAFYPSLGERPCIGVLLEACVAQACSYRALSHLQWLGLTTIDIEREHYCFYSYDPQELFAPRRTCSHASLDVPCTAPVHRQGQGTLRTRLSPFPLRLSPNSV